MSNTNLSLPAAVRLLRSCAEIIAAGVPTTLVEYRGLSHGFINTAAFLTAGRLALDQVSATLRQALNSPELR